MKKSAELTTDFNANEMRLAATGEANVGVQKDVLDILSLRIRVKTRRFSGVKVCASSWVFSVFYSGVA